MAEVTFAEANLIKAYRVCELLLTKGYALATSNGQEIVRPDECVAVGILRGERYRPRKFWFKARRERDFIGVIWFSNKERGANNQKWIFEVFGRENLPELRVFAEQLTKTFGIDIHLRLETENAKSEWLVLHYADW